MSYATFSIDRRAEYYARIADLIAADPLWFYNRAAKGGRYKDWLRAVAYRCAWLRPRAKVVPIESARRRRA